MRKERLELSRVSPQEPKSCASTSSATFASGTPHTFRATPETSGNYNGAGPPPAENCPKCRPLCPRSAKRPGILAGPFRIFGGPYRNRTYNQWIKSPLLCLIELTAQMYPGAPLGRPFLKTGVDDGTRTHDDRNHNPGLYQLSYAHHNCILIATGQWRARQDSNLQPSA